MTDQIMHWFADCRKRGLFGYGKKKEYGAAWKEVVERCKEKWPRHNWSENIVSTKYDTERRRFHLWQALMDLPDVTVDPDSRMFVVPDATWAQFVRRYGSPSRSVAWMRTQPLGNLDLYHSVFGDNTPRYYSQRDTTMPDSLSSESCPCREEDCERSTTYPPYCLLRESLPCLAYGPGILVLICVHRSLWIGGLPGSSTRPKQVLRSALSSSLFSDDTYHVQRLTRSARYMSRGTLP